MLVLSVLRTMILQIGLIHTATVVVVVKLNSHTYSKIRSSRTITGWSRSYPPPGGTSLALSSQPGRNLAKSSAWLGAVGSLPVESDPGSAARFDLDFREDPGGLIVSDTAGNAELVGLSPCGDNLR